MKSLPRLSVENPIIVSLLMYALMLGGAYSAFTLVREMFPETRPNQVMIITSYPGASPAEVEKGISLKIEEQIKDIEGIEKLDTTVSEGMSSIAAVLYNEVDDVDRVVTDIKNAIDTIPRDDFPEEAEETIVSRFEPTLPVISASWYGDMTDEQLKYVGKRLRDDILALDGITEAQLSGTRSDEISVEVRPDQLIRYGISFTEITDAITRGNMDLPGGQVKTVGANVAVRTLGEKDCGEELENLIVRADGDGRIVRLSDVATVIDGFEDVDLRSRIDGKPGVSVTVSKTPSQDAISISRKVKALVAGKNHEPFECTWMERLLGRDKGLVEIYEQARLDPYPRYGKLKTHTNLARYIDGRLDLLRRNGLWGLVFVFLSLLFFVNWRVAFWVMMGLLLAILGTMVAMKWAGITLNLISAFGLIVVLGMLVDDAIIVGEHTFTKIENGVAPELAAVEGAEEVAKPVTCAIVTTIVAFAPLLFISGTMGDFMGILPVIVILSLSISLFEALTILPSHLAESFAKAARREARRRERHAGPWARFRWWLRDAQHGILENRIRKGYAALLRRAVSYRYVTMGIALACLIAIGGLIGGGIVEVVFFQDMDAETLIAAAELPTGSPLDETDKVMQVIERASDDVPEMDTRFTLVGTQLSFGNTGSALGQIQTHHGQMIIELLPAEERDRSSDEITLQMRERTAGVTGVNSLTFRPMHGGPGGAPISIEVAGESLGDLVAVTSKIKSALREYAGVYDIEDNFDAGQREVQIELLDSGRALGLTTQSLAMQIRAAFYGLEARKIQREREDVKIMVRYPASFRTRIDDLCQMRVAVGGGQLVPISEVARISEGTGYATIRRMNQKRTVTVSADVDQHVANAKEILTELIPRLDGWCHDYAGVSYAFRGDQEEFAKSFSSLKRDQTIALILVFTILVALFKSYIQPVIVMTAIPFGLIGAVIGHYVMGYPLTFLSLIGLVALTGIVVNDSLILVDFINRRVAVGEEIHEAVVQGGLARLRAIILTSITTVLGLAPLLCETSLQAKFLIPMGVSIAFGLAFATVVTLVVVPCLYVMQDDARRMWRNLRRWAWPEINPEVSS